MVTIMIQETIFIIISVIVFYECLHYFLVPSTYALIATIILFGTLINF